MKKIELLAPAGDMNALKAAVYAGCDAVYLGGPFFGARNYAKNFNLEELKEAILFCHLYRVKVYITVNILVYEAETLSFMKYIDALVALGVDALIMQDLGMIDWVLKVYPSMEIHASTQMNIHTLEGVKFAKELGLKRVVLAREVDIETISYIHQKVDIDLEVFGHGALCLSYSGQCLMSSLIGGRSGNRGTCTQSCRKPYLLRDVCGNIKNKNQYILSMKDLNILENIDKFIESGITSLKIEGRMKRAEYVYIVVSLYRKAIDSYYQKEKFRITHEEIQSLKKIFNRQFTKGFLFNEQNSKITNDFRPNHMGVKVGKVYSVNNRQISIELYSELSKNDGIRIINEKGDQGGTVSKMTQKGHIVLSANHGIITIPFTGKVTIGDWVLRTSDCKQLEEIQRKIRNPLRKVELSVSIVIQLREPIHLSATDGIYTIEVNDEYRVERATRQCISEQIIKEKLEKLGGTIYTIRELNLILDPNVFFPIHILNNIRRKMVDLLNKKRVEVKKHSKHTYSITVPSFPKICEKSVYISSLALYEQVHPMFFNHIYVEEDLYKKIGKNSNVILCLPCVMKQYKSIKQMVLVREVGSLLPYKNKITDTSFNVTNSYTIAFLHNLGVKKVTLSHELNLFQIKKIISSYQNRYHENPNLEYVCFGREKVMITKYNLLKQYHLKEGFLEDSYKNRYYITEKNNLNIIYNYRLKNEMNYDLFYDLGIHSLRFDIICKEDLKKIKT